MSDLGAYGDWLGTASAPADLYPKADPGPRLQRLIRQTLGCDADQAPADISVDRQWVDGGLMGQQVSWSVGYGPRTKAWLLRPEKATQPLPGILALHDHGGTKFFGKEKIADDDRPPAASIHEMRHRAYGGRAFANALALAGFVVLVPDVFLWGSRRFAIADMPACVTDVVQWHQAANPATDEVARYDLAAAHHEHIVAKYATALGTSLAGVVAYEDRVAATYLLSRDDVRPRHLGCVGLSGGGARAALLQATMDRMGATVIAGMMSAQAHLLPRHILPHTWMFFPPGLARLADWPDLAGARAPSPLLVQYNRQDALFPPAGMAAADERLTEIYAGQNAAARYQGAFFDGPHKFDLEMQDQAFAWLADRL